MYSSACVEDLLMSVYAPTSKYDEAFPEAVVGHVWSVLWEAKAGRTEVTSQEKKLLEKKRAVKEGRNGRGFLLMDNSPLEEEDETHGFGCKKKSGKVCRSGRK